MTDRGPDHHPEELIHVTTTDAGRGARTALHRTLTHRTLARRTLLRTAGLGAAAGLTACTAAPTGADRETAAPPTYVLVGGNGAPSFFWTPVVRELALLGHRAHAVEMPLHGLEAEMTPAYQSPQDLSALGAQPSGLSGVPLADYTQAVVDVVDRVARNGPVVLVGHSLGGAAITLAADAVPDRVDHLVYVSAVCCTRLRSAFDAVLAPENAESWFLPEPDGSPRLRSAELGRPDLTGVTHTNWRTADLAYLESFHEAAMAEATQSQFLAALTYCHQAFESATVSLEDARGRAEGWGTVPRTFVRLTADRLLTPPLQDRMIADADRLTPENPFRVTDLDTSHVGILFAADRLADLLGQVDV